MRLPSRGFAFVCAFCLASFATAYPQDSVDQLFDTPQADSETQSTDASQLLNAFHAQPLTVTGSFTSMAGIVVGYTDGSVNKVPDGTYVFGQTPGLDFTPSITFAARPDETIRFQGTVSFPFGATNMFAPDIDEIFFDYTLQDAVYFRIGRHLVNWGAARLFDVGGDLMSNSSQGLNLKASVPVGSGSVTAILLTPQSIYTDFSWSALTYGAQADLPVGKAEIILSGKYNGDDSGGLPLRATAIVRTSIYGVDLFAEGIGASTLVQTPSISASPSVSGIIGGFYWERVDPEYKLYGEYYFNAGDKTMRDQRVSLVAGANNAFGTRLNLGLQWSHAFVDNSGIVVPGFSVNLWRHVSLQVGLPFRYGAPGSFYLVNQSPTVQSSVVPTNVLTWAQRYGILVRLNLSTGF